MSDRRTRLNPTQVREAGLADWRQLSQGIRARFRTGDFATGLVFVQAVGAVAEAADHHPDVSLNYGEVILTLMSHDVRGITSRDIDLARQISAIAAEHGVQADVAGLVQLEPALDTPDGRRLAPFYAALVGGDVRDDEPVDPSGQVPAMWFQEPGSGGPELPSAEPEQRWHLDVWVPHDQGEERLRAVLDAGGRLVSDAAAPAYWVVEDLDGNRSCICTTLDR